MATWKILLMIAGMLVAGCVVGALTGKYLVKRSRTDHKAVLGVRQRVVFFSCILIGAGCILVGFWLDHRSVAEPGGGMMGEMDAALNAGWEETPEIVDEAVVAMKETVEMVAEAVPDADEEAPVADDAAEPSDDNAE